jgi:hypothetical protein
VPPQPTIKLLNCLQNFRSPPLAEPPSVADLVRDWYANRRLALKADLRPQLNERVSELSRGAQAPEFWSGIGNPMLVQR